MSSLADVLDAIHAVLPALRDVADKRVGALSPEAADALVRAVDGMPSGRQVSIGHSIATLVLDANLPLVVHGVRDTADGNLKAAVIVIQGDALDLGMQWYNEQDPVLRTAS